MPNKTNTKTSTSRTTVAVGRIDKSTDTSTVKTGSATLDQLVTIRTGRN